MAEIKGKYKDVLGRNWEALKDPDVFGFLFLANPQAMLGFSAIKRSPLAVLHLLETITGGMDSITSLRQRLASSAAYTPRTTPPATPPSGGGGGMGYDDGGMGGFGESRKRGNNLLEQNPVPPQQQQQQPPQQPQAAQQAGGVEQEIMALIKQPEVQQAIASSPIFQDMQKASVDIMMAPVLRFLKAQNLEQMKGFIDPAAIEKAKAELNKNPEFQKANPQTKQQVAGEFIKKVKLAYVDQYVKWLSGMTKDNPGAKPEVNAAAAKLKAAVK
jgi:hypothetical protein